MQGRCKVIVKWELGLHIRPATHLISLLRQYSCDIRFIKGRMDCNAKSLIQILKLGAVYGDQIIVEIDGQDAQEVLERIEYFFEHHEDEDIIVCQ